MYILTALIRGEDFIVPNVGAELGPRSYTCYLSGVLTGYRLLSRIVVCEAWGH